MIAARTSSRIGAYQLIELLGEGGMGAVWLAEHESIGRRAAIKVLHPKYMSQPDILARFFNEARAVTAINDPGIVQIFDVGQDDELGAYIVMEVLDGETLASRLAARGKLAPTEALRIARQIAISLDAAHARGIIHRDLKPENIFLVHDAEVVGGERTKLLDFGIAKLVSPDVGVKTQTSQLLGTPTYMSPEQCRGAGEVDHRADIYSLGCTLFAMLTGAPPFVAAGAGELIVMHLTEPAPKLSTVAPGIGRLVARCLEKDPDQRPASGRQIADEIGALLGTTPAPGIVAAVDLAPPVRGRRWAAIAAALVLLAGAAVAAIAMTSDSSDESVASPTPHAPRPPAAIAPAPTPAPPALEIVPTPTQPAAPTPVEGAPPAPAPVAHGPEPAQPLRGKPRHVQAAVHAAPTNSTPPAPAPAPTPAPPPTPSVVLDKDGIPVTR